MAGQQPAGESARWDSSQQLADCLQDALYLCKAAVQGFAQEEHLMALLLKLSFQGPRPP